MQDLDARFLDDVLITSTKDIDDGKVNLKMHHLKVCLMSLLIN